MAFTDYTILPKFNTVIVDGETAAGVSMAGISPTVDNIIWLGLQTKGTICFEPNPVTGVLPAPGSFTNPNQYIAQVTEAQAIIFAANNPETYYSTANENVYEGVIYPIGTPIVIYTPDTPQPTETTTTVPPSPEAWELLYWYNSAWVVSSVDPTLTLAVAKSTLITEVNTSAAAAGADQARIYSPVQLFAAADVDTLATADYAGETLGTYQTFLDGQVFAKTATVNAATTVTQLYDFNPNVVSDPNA